MARDDQSITMNTNEILRDKMTQLFFTEVHLLASKLVPVVTIHPLGGSCANRHHTPNPQSGAAQPTQDGDPQATRNPLELPLVISHGEGTRTPHKHLKWGRTQSPNPLTKQQITNRLGDGNHQE